MMIYLIDHSFNFEQFKNNKAQFDPIVIIYQPMLKQVFLVKNE